MLVDSDLELIQRTLAGEVDAFGFLVERYEPRLLRALAFRLGCWEAARDAAQEAFVHAYTKLASFHGESGFYTWLYRIALNLSISGARKRRPITLADAGENGVLESVDHHGAPSDPLEQAEAASLVRRAIAALGEEHQEIVTLREIEELSYEEIAEQLQIPIGTVRSRLARARDQLRQLLRSAMEEGKGPLVSAHPITGPTQR